MCFRLKSCTFGNKALGRVGQASSQKPTVLLKRKHIQCSCISLHHTRKLRQAQFRPLPGMWTPSLEVFKLQLHRGLMVLSMLPLPWQVDHRIFWGPFPPHLSYDSIKIAPSPPLKQSISPQWLKAWFVTKTFQCQCCFPVILKKNWKGLQSFQDFNKIAVQTLNCGSLAAPARKPSSAWKQNVITRRLIA